uniref:hypothetical protein n=1 Tax=Stenotrophomonas sp. YIM B06876 TaxID=3060211 RepID=UPI00273A38BD
RGTGLHAAYDTRQIFTDRYPHGAHTVLPPWDFVPRKTDGEVFRAKLQAFLAPLRAQQRPRPQPRPKLPAVALMMQLPPDERLKLAQRYAARVA